MRVFPSRGAWNSTAAMGAVVFAGALFGAAPSAGGNSTSAGTRSVIIGGEVRLRYEHFENSQWGQGPQDEDGYLLRRVVLHADAHASDQLRLFGELKSGIADGRVGGPRPTDEDRLDLGQAFVDWSFVPADGDRAALRVGRQEIAFGSSRLISFRDGPNVRLSFDGVRGTWWSHDWKVDGFGVAPVSTDRGSFDDRSVRGQRLWGAYATKTLASRTSGIDVYYLGLRRDTARFAQGIADEERHSVGTRCWGKRGDWDFNTEVVLQGGRFGSTSIRAWTVASDTGYTFTDAVGKPKLSLKANIASGDRNPQDGTLGTFNALFPRGAYFSESALIGPANFYDLHPAWTVNPHPKVSLTVDADFFWRQSSRDGLYGPSLNLLRRAGTSEGSRYVGAHTGLLVNWKLGRQWSSSAIYSRFFAGPFLHESGPSADVGYLAISVTYTI